MSTTARYDAVDAAARPGGIPNGTARNQDGENQPLLGTRKSPAGMTARFRGHMTENVNRDWADIVLIFCYLITGMLDASSISIWGAFVSMQTGNTVYLGLGLASPHASTRWIKSSVSVASFCIGSFLFARFHRRFSAARRWVLCASFSLQAVLTLAAAVILSLYPPAGREDISWYAVVPVALVAFQACGQAVTSRALRHNTLTSVVLTSIYCDLFSDPRIFADDNIERNRRVSAPLMLGLGAFLGGVFARNDSTASALWTAAALKLVVALAWFVWPGEESRGEENGSGN